MKRALFASLALLALSAGGAEAAHRKHHARAYDFTAAVLPANKTTPDYIVGGIYNTTLPTLSNLQPGVLQLDSAGRLIVNVGAGGGAGGTSSSFNASFPGTGTAAGAENPSLNMVPFQVDASNNLYVNCNVGCAGGSTSNAGSGVATSSNNGKTVSYNYGFNGSTWDQLQVDGSKNLNVNVQASVNPTGGATAANQSTIITDLGTLLSDFTTLITAVENGVGATGSAVPADAIYNGGNAQASEPAATTTGDLTGAFFDLAGKQVTSPYANRENQLRCAVTITASTAATTCTGMGAQGAGVKIYVTDVSCTRNDAGTTAVTMTMNDSATTPFDLPNNGGGGGFSHTYNTPLVVAANTAFQFTSGTSITSEHCSATGFKGY